MPKGASDGERSQIWGLMSMIDAHPSLQKPLMLSLKRRIFLLLDPSRAVRAVISRAEWEVLGWQRGRAVLQAKAFPSANGSLMDRRVGLEWDFAADRDWENCLPSVQELPVGAARDSVILSRREQTELGSSHGVQREW